VSAIFISHSSRDDDTARVVRSRLSRVLADPPYSHDVLLDEDRIQAGDLWRPMLYRWLAECGGAVLLLTKQALASEWVRKEATILLWRHALGSNVIVIPVLIGVSQSDAEAAFPTIEVFEHQYINAAEPISSDDLVTSIARNFGQAFVEKDKLGDWAARLEAQVSGLDHYYQSELARTLHAATQGWPDTPDGVRMIVHALLYLERMFEVQTAVEPVLAQLRDPKGFVDLIAPIGVPPETSAGILSVFSRPPGERVLVLSASGILTASRYIKRATCVDSFYKTAEFPAVVDSRGAAALFDAIFTAIADQILRCPKEFDAARRRQFVESTMNAEDRRGRIIQLLRAKSSPDDDGLPRRLLDPLVKRLRSEIPRLVILILVGPPYPAEPDLGIPGAHVVRPAVKDPMDEAMENSYLDRLQTLVT
jgi:hypothetical protein